MKGDILSMKTWKNVSKILDPTIPSRLMEDYDIKVPTEFFEYVTTYNGGRLDPKPYIYNQNESRGVVVSGLLSFNERDEKNVFNTINKLVHMDKTLVGLPFAYSDRGVMMISGNTVYHRDKDTGKIWILDDSFIHFMRASM